MSAAIRDSSSTAVRVWVSAWVVASAAVETPVMLFAISPVPPAASLTDRDISCVVAVCSSTALAMVAWRSEIWPTIWLISSMAVTAAPVSCWIACTGGFDGGVERQQVGLLRDARDHLDHVADL